MIGVVLVVMVVVVGDVQGRRCRERMVPGN